MSRRLLLIAVMLCAVAGPVQGQELEQLERRAAILKLRYDQMRDSLEQEAAHAFDRQPRVTVQGEGFAIAAPEWAVHRLAQGLVANAPRWRERYGSTFETLRDDTLVVWISGPDTGRRLLYQNIEWRFAGNADTTQMLVGMRRSYDPLESYPTAAVVAWERSLLDPVTTAWLGWPVSSAGPADLSRGALSTLFRSDAGPARRCLAGQIADCERLLDLDAPADSVTRWYDRSDRAWRRAVSYLHPDTPGRARCLAAQTYDACYAVIRTQGARMPRPVGNVLRESFYRFVVETGGDGAIERFRTSTGRTPAERFSAVAGRPVGELVPEWRAWLDRTRTDERGDIGTIVLAAVGWMTVFALFFAWRFRWIRV